MSKQTRTHRRSRKESARRDFLVGSLSWAGLAALGPVVTTAGCANLDRLIVGDGDDESAKVVILGAGLSGLVAARELRRLGTPFRIYESQRRIGGRILSVNSFNAADQTADLGGEWIRDDDDFVLGLCKELKIPLEAVPWSLRLPQRLLESKRQELRLQAAEFQTFNRRVLDWKSQLSAEKIDRFSGQDLWQTHGRGLSAESEWLWQAIVQREWGVDPQELSALQLLDRMGEHPFGLETWKARRWHLPGGAAVLPRALFDKIAGVIPDQLVVREHRLTEVREKLGKLFLSFETPKGDFEIKAEVVICTLPWSVLRKVKGVDSLSFGALKTEAISDLNFSTSAKASASFTNRFWNGKGGEWITDSTVQIWDATPQVQPLAPVSRGVLTWQMNGQAGAEAGPESIVGCLSKIAALTNKGQELSAEAYQVMNWQSSPDSLGSQPYLRPGQVHRWSEVLGTAERKGRFVFAGDATLYDGMGTLNGAVQSGIRAAREATQVRSRSTPASG